MNILTTGTPPEAFPDANLPLDYFWQFVDTPAGLWTIRLLLAACVVAMVVGYLHYSKRESSATAQPDVNKPEDREVGK